jgi:hypothetical protein
MVGEGLATNTLSLTMRRVNTDMPNKSKHYGGHQSRKYSMISNSRRQVESSKAVDASIH